MDDDELRKALKLKSRNAGRDYWYWKDKPLMELGAVRDILVAAGCKVEELTSRTDDPPDCEALIDGQRCGIEATELVHEKALALTLRTKQELLYVWDKDSLRQELQARIIRKDRPDKVKGGPYQRYILVIFTDEFFLDRSAVEHYLDGASFRVKFISDVFLGLSYDPKIGRCPVLKLSLVTDR
jgi:hypothetical protein